jgi:hypothetical protein
LQKAILKEFEAVPRVTSAAIASSAPMEGGSGNSVYAADREYAAGGLPPVRQMRDVSPGSSPLAAAACWQDATSHGLKYTIRHRSR